jgi:hypothetical protein
LRIAIHQQRVQLGRGERSRQVDGSRSFPDATFLIGNGNNAGHISVFVENQRLEGQHSAEAARLQCRIAVHAALRSIYLKQRRLWIFRSALSTRASAAASENVPRGTFEFQSIWSPSQNLSSAKKTFRMLQTELAPCIRKASMFHVEHFRLPSA